MQAPPKWLPIVLGAAALSTSAYAQRTLIAGIQGEPPDTSNWPHPAAPDGNPFVQSSASAADINQRDMVSQLGKTLFWEEQVSVDNTMACGTCHMPRAGGTDNRAGAVAPNGAFGAFGMVPQAISQFGTIDYGFLAPASTQIDRSVTPVTPPTMIGAYLFHRLFWDERAGPDFLDEFLVQVPNFPDWAALEALSVGPPLSDVEMGHQALTWSSGLLQMKLDDSFPLAMVDPGTVPPDIQWITTMGATYQRVFDIVFSGHSDPNLAGSSGVTRERFAAALANYHRTLIPDQAPIDLGQMTKRQIRGFEIMQQSDCFRCHSATGNPDIQGSGPLADPFDNAFSDGFSHDIGVAGVRRKTATLRNVGLHTKWTSTGHGGDGTIRLFVASQSDLLDFYEQEPPPLGTGPLSLSDRASLAAFLFDALTDPRVASEQFPFDRPVLYSEMNAFEANEYGFGTPAPGTTLVPEIIANSPPQILPNGGLPWFKVGVGDAPPNSGAFLLVSGAPSFTTAPIFVAAPFMMLATNPTNAQGIGTAQQPVPLVPSMIGVPLYAQWMIIDTRYGRAFSDAAEFFPFHW